MKKKILILAGTLDIGGVEKSLISLLQSIDFDRYDIDLILKSGGVFKKYVPKEVKIIESPEFYKWIFLPRNNLLKATIASIDLNFNFMRVMYYLLKGLAIKNMARARQELMESCMHTLPYFSDTYDVAIDYTGGLKSLLINKTNAKKKLTWVHSDYKVFRRNKNIDFRDYSRIDSIITVSNTCYDIFTSEFPQYRTKCYVIPNITNKNQIIKMSNEEADFDDSYSGIKILDITRLDPNKGIDIAVKSCKTLIEKGYDIKWYILGDGPEKYKIENLIKEHHLQDKFILLGVKDNPYPFIKKADIIVHCSLFEGRSVAIDEAMLLAKPIILTNYPTAKDQINDKENGLICDISVEGVCNAVETLIDDKALRNKLSHSLYKYDISVKSSLNEFYKLIDKN